jgi:hypothetical protein
MVEERVIAVSVTQKLQYSRQACTEMKKKLLVTPDSRKFGPRKRRHIG